MGKHHGITKARDGETASAAAIKRWNLHDELAAAQEENKRLRERLGIVTPMRKKKKK
jgi:hypothetical protein